MLLFQTLILFICIYSIHFRREISGNILSVNQTATINGIFVLYIFLGHASQYIVLDGSIYNKVYAIVDGQIGQLCVTSFLFFSGYGIMESIKRKKNYINSMFRNRIVVTLLNFDFAIVLFFIMNNMLNIHYDAKTYLLALTGIKHVGNSNWYIFTMLSMYMITFIIGKCSISEKRIPWTQVVMTCIFILIMKYCFNFPSRFYSTVLCYPFGMLFSNYKEKIFDYVNKNKIKSYVYIIIPFLSIVIFHLRSNDFVYNIFSCLFVLLLVRIMYTHTIDNVYLEYLGKHCFSIYILQRIPMTIITRYLGENCKPIVFLLISIVLTLIFSFIFDYITEKMDKVIRRVNC